MSTLCRSCFKTGDRAVEAEPAEGKRRCSACGGHRVLRHPELHDLEIAHIDYDAFYANVEKRDRPELRDKPVIIGGGQRGVVSTACYVARVYGIHSAMPMFKARKLCPDAVVLRPDMAKYQAIGRRIRDREVAAYLEAGRLVVRGHEAAKRRVRPQRLVSARGR